MLKPRSVMCRRLAGLLGGIAWVVMLPACGSPAYHAIGYVAPARTMIAWTDQTAFRPIRRVRRAVTPVPAALATVSAPGFDLRVEDQTLGDALMRWAKETGSTIRWESPIAVPVTAASHIPGTLPDAMEVVKAALNRNGYPLVIVQAPEHRLWLVLDAPKTSTAGASTS